MRRVEDFTTKGGEHRFKVRYRSGGKQTSETFYAKTDAERFATLLDAGGNVAALNWLTDRNNASTPDAYTFGEWFEMFVDGLTGVEARTPADYRAMRRRYLTEFDALPLPLITRKHVTELVNRMDRDRGLSPKTISNTVRMLASCLALAVDEGHITRNPTKRVRLPKARHDEHEARFLTGSEFAALLDATPAHYRPLVTFLVGTGLRWSEATALQVRHVDLDHGTVRVGQAWKRTPGGEAGFELGPPKTTKGRRTVNAAVAALVAVAPLVEGRAASEYVFTTVTGRVVQHSNFFNRIWAPACRRAGLDPAPSPHDLRHTHASWLISEGIALEAIQDQLGHESILTTRNTYAQLLPTVGVAVGKAASEALARALAVEAPRLIA